MSIIETPQLNARQIKAQYAAEKAARDVADAERREMRTRKAAQRAETWAAWTAWIPALGRVARALLIGLMTLAIAGFALYVSFHHIRDLCLMAGWDTETAMATPATLDLMLFIASMQLRRKGITPTARFIARACMLFGLVGSLAANTLHGWLTADAGLDTFSLAWRLTLSAVPVLALLGATEMLTHTHKAPGKAKARKASLLRRLLVALVARAERRAAEPIVETATPAHATL